MGAEQVTTQQAVSLVTWALISVLLVLLMLVARFYQRSSGKKTHYWVFAVPIILFGAAAVRTAFLNQTGGDPLSDGLWAIGGFTFILMCLRIYAVMSDKN